MVAPLWEQLQEYQDRRLTLEENFVAVIAQDRVIDEYLKKQIKNQTLGCNKEVGNKLNTTLFNLINIIYKTVMPSYLEKLQIPQKINKLMFKSFSYFLIEFW